MSCGVASSVTAALLSNFGYNVTGFTMQLSEGASKKNQKTCCSGVDISDARKVAKRLNIRHYIIDYKEKFKESVIDKFVNSYIEGQTPIPCILCNQTVKFTDLINFTRSIKSEVLATGHYVKRIEKGEDVNLYQADDGYKDQSYFLFATTQDQLKTLRFPLGSFSKSYIRELALYFGLTNAKKPDSQYICFIPDGNYRDFIKKKITNPNKMGDIVNFKGEIIGSHKGIINFTIVQRNGINIGGTKAQNEHSPLYVKDIDKKNNKVIVGPRSRLMKYSN